MEGSSGASRRHDSRGASIRVYIAAESGIGPKHTSAWEDEAMRLRRPNTPAASFDILVVGAGHAGCEAALAAARLGRRTALLSTSLGTVAQMPCNPSIGGPAKGNLVREVDALGGEMGRNTDRTQIQIRELNTGKGPAVRALRAQCDKHAYGRLMRRVLESQPNLTLLEAHVEGLIWDSEPSKGAPAWRVRGVRTSEGEEIRARATVVTTGTFLQGRIILGDTESPGGRRGDRPPRPCPKTCVGPAWNWAVSRPAHTAAPRRRQHRLHPYPRAAR